MRVKSVCHIVRLMEVLDWTLVAATSVVVGLGIYIQRNHITEAKPQRIISKLERAYQLPLTLDSGKTYGIDKEEIISNLESALELEKIKNVALRSEIDKAKYLIEEIFLASKSSLLAIDKKKIQASSVKELQSPDKEPSTSDVLSNSDETNLTRNTHQPVAIPVAKPSELAHQKGDRGSSKRIVPALNPKTAPRKIVSSAQSKAPSISAGPDNTARPATNAIHLETVSPEIGKILANFQHQPTEQGFKVVVPGTDLFVRNSRNIAPDAHSILEPIAKVANLNKDLKLEIVGHTDSLKSVADSNKLSRQRAELVKQLLSEKLHVDAGRMSVDGKGKDRPIASNATLDGRRVNRRTEIWFFR